MSQIVLVTGLIGTTVVPYNLYLHSSAIRERRWPENPNSFLVMARIDTVIPIFLGGVVTMAIGVVAASVLNPEFLAGNLEINNAADMSNALAPILGPISYLFFNLGLVAAAISSMPMAALAAAYVTTESFGLSSNLKSTPSRVVLTITAWGPALIYVVAKSSPVATIIAAQSINGVLLPITAIFVFYLANKEKVMGELVNKLWFNVIAFLSILFVTVLGVINILQAVGII